MGLFSSKSKMSVEDCCRIFCDSLILKAKTVFAGTDSWPYVLTQFRDQLVEADQLFSTVDLDTFGREMTALNVAIFGQQCSRKLHHKIDMVLRPALFTKGYLEENRRQDIWDSMVKYNKVIGDSAYMRADGQMADGNSGWGRGRIAFVNSFRFGMFEEWIQKNIGDPGSGLTPEQKEKLDGLNVALQHVCARSDSVALRLLGVTLAQRLGCDINHNQKAQLVVVSIISCFHRGAKRYLESITLK